MASKLGVGVTHRMRAWYARAVSSAWSPSRRAPARTIRRSGALAALEAPASDAPASTLPAGMGETVDLIAKRLVTHAAPYVQNDPAMQQRIGAAAGAAAADRVSGPITLAALAVTAAAVVVVARAF